MRAGSHSKVQGSLSLKVTWCRVGVFVLLTQRVKGIDRSFVQVKVDVLWHRERFIFPILSPKADKSLFV